MERNLKITSGSDTVWLSSNVSGQFMVLEYLPTSVYDKQGRANDAVDLITNGLTHRTAFAQINQMFERARIWRDQRSGAPVYLEIQFDEVVWWRAELFDGRAEYEAKKVGNRWDAKAIPVTVYLERSVWEGPETELALTNSSGSGTGGRAVGNENYSSTENWVTVAGTNVSGDLPAHTRLELTHTYGTNPFIKEIWLYHKTDNPAAFVHFIQGESATGGSNTADATASGGSKKSLSWSVTSKTKLLEWTLTAASLNAMAGGQTHFMLRHDGAAYSDLYLQFVLRNPTGYTLIQEGSLTPMPSGNEMQVIDTFRLPPGGVISASSDLILELWAQRLSAGTHSLAIDFVQISPVSPGNSWHKLTSIGTGLRVNEKLVVDNIEERIYRVVSATNIADWSAEGSGIQLQPGRDQRIYFLAAEVGNNYRRLQTFTARLYYRARRRSL